MLAAWVATSLLNLLVSLSAQGADGITHLNLQTIGRGPASISVSQTRATVVVFISTDCPMSMDYGIRIGKLAEAYSNRSVQVILVASNSNETDVDVEKFRQALKVATPVYRDHHATVAGLLSVVATPTAVVLDSAGTIRYKGNIDDSRNPAKVKQHFVQAAVDAVLSGQPVQVQHTRVLGCSIKR